MGRSLVLVLSMALLAATNGCLQETAAVDPWLADTAAPTDAGADGVDATEASQPPSGWTAVQVALDAGEAIVDWYGATVNDVPTLFFLSDWGRLGRLQPGQPAETVHAFASATPQAFRGVWTADGKSFWIVGKASTLWKGKVGFWDQVDLADEFDGDWLDVWGNGTSVLWLSGEAGAFLRLGADGKDPQLFHNGTSAAYHSLTGLADVAWMASSGILVKLTNGTDFTDRPVLAGIAAGSIATDQVIQRIFAVDEMHLYLVGKPTQLVRDSGSAKLDFANPAVFAGINPFFDVHGLPNGRRLVCGTAGEIHELDASDAEVPMEREGLPLAEDLRRVWLFEDGSAYVLSATSGVYHRPARP